MGDTLENNLFLVPISLHNLTCQKLHYLNTLNETKITAIKGLDRPMNYIHTLDMKLTLETIKKQINNVQHCLLNTWAPNLEGLDPSRKAGWPSIYDGNRPPKLIIMRAVLRRCCRRNGRGGRSPVLMEQR